MWIQHFDLEVCDSQGPLYRGNTYFGFFPAEALAQQVGLPGAVARTIPPREAMRGKAFQVPHYSDGPDPRFRMVDDVELFVPDGGTAGLGFIRGGIDVDPNAWFFRAHFMGRSGMARKSRPGIDAPALAGGSQGSLGVVTSSGSPVPWLRGFRTDGPIEGR